MFSHQADSRAAVRVCIAGTSALADHDLADRCWALIDADERGRVMRQRREENRREHLAAYALVRLTLSRFRDTLPSAWRFRRDPNGRPEVENPAAGRDLRFSLSHTHGLVVCGATCDVPVGVDAERIEYVSDHLEIAARYFAPEEADALAKLPEELRSARFVEYWTLKEAYAKAKGLGLSLSLNSAIFDLSLGDGAVSVRFDESVADDPSAWSFSLIPEPAHRVALARRLGRGNDGAVIIERIDGVRDWEEALARY